MRDDSIPLIDFGRRWSLAMAAGCGLQLQTDRYQATHMATSAGRSTAGKLPIASRGFW